MNDPLRDMIVQMTTQQQRLFACECAERVIPFFERKRTDGYKLRDAIKTAVDHANGQATNEELGKAYTKVRNMAEAFCISHPASWAARAVAAAAARHPDGLFINDWHEIAMTSRLRSGTVAALLAIIAASCSLTAHIASVKTEEDRERMEIEEETWQLERAKQILDM